MTVAQPATLGISIPTVSCAIRLHRERDPTGGRTLRWFPPQKSRNQSIPPPGVAFRSPALTCSKVHTIAPWGAEHIHGRGTYRWRSTETRRLSTTLWTLSAESKGVSAAVIAAVVVT